VTFCIAASVRAPLCYEWVDIMENQFVEFSLVLYVSKYTREQKHQAQNIMFRKRRYLFKMTGCMIVSAQ